MPNLLAGTLFGFLLLPLLLWLGNALWGQDTYPLPELEGAVEEFPGARVVSTTELLSGTGGIMTSPTWRHAGWGRVL